MFFFFFLIGPLFIILFLSGEHHDVLHCPLRRRSVWEERAPLRERLFLCKNKLAETTFNCCEHARQLILAFWGHMRRLPPPHLSSASPRVQSCPGISSYDPALVVSFLFVSSSSHRNLGLITVTLPACLSLTRLCPDSTLIPALPFKGSTSPPWLLEPSPQS